MLRNDKTCFTRCLMNAHNAGTATSNTACSEKLELDSSVGPVVCSLNVGRFETVNIITARS